MKIIILSIFPIPNIVFVILIAILTVFLTFYTAKGGLTDNRFSRLWKRITLRGKKVIGILIIIGTLLTLQECNNQSASKQKDSIINKDNLKRDSIITARIKAGVDSNRRELFGDISEAFKKQGLMLDTIEKAIKDTTFSSPNKQFASINSISSVVNSIADPIPQYVFVEFSFTGSVEAAVATEIDKFLAKKGIPIYNVDLVKEISDSEAMYSPLPPPENRLIFSLYISKNKGIIAEYRGFYNWNKSVSPLIYGNFISQGDLKMLYNSEHYIDYRGHLQLYLKKTAKGITRLSQIVDGKISDSVYSIYSRQNDFSQLQATFNIGGTIRRVILSYDKKAKIFL